MNPLFLELQIREKKREMLEESERRRLLAAYNLNSPGPWAKVQLLLGELLIRLGEKMKRRYTQQPDMGHDLCRE